MLATLLLCALTPFFAPLQQRAEDRTQAFAGDWMTGFGPLKLVVQGTNIAGTYGWANDSRVEGQLDGERFAFRWSGPSGRGDGWFALWKDGRTFSGEYTFGGGRDYWGGYRRAPRRAEVQPGIVTDGQSTSGLEYHLRVPKDFDPKKRWTALALFHGSNANSRDYVEGFPGNWPKLADRYILVGFDGERLSPASREGLRTFNSSYVEFSGHDVGEPWRKNQTPWLVAQALDELAHELPIERWYASGHSQGAFLTLALAMFYPERVAGVIEVAGNLLVQCEPSCFADEQVRAAQRRVPIALVHGEKDTVVDFSAATYTFDCLDDGGFPALRLFSAENLGHPWAFLPLDHALDWLDALTSPDPKGLLEFARGSIAAEAWRDASVALQRARELSQDPAHLKLAAELAAVLDAAATKAAEPLARAIAADENAKWVDDFWSFRARFGLTPAAAGVLKAYLKLRATHEKPAEERFNRARAEPNPTQKQALYREIVERYYASRWYRLVKSWLKSS
jgi:phospholipase/carboxylesterase